MALLLLASSAVALIVPASATAIVMPREAAITPGLVRRINADPLIPYTADTASPFASWELHQVASLCGSLSDSSLSLPLATPPPPEVLASLPPAFDARDEWGSMCPSVLEVRDQAGCGACWAFGAAEAMTDRTCIHSKGLQTPHLSAAEIMSCDNDNSYGCNGGDTIAAWQWWVSDGVVDGGTVEDDTVGGCVPFPFPRCDHLNSTDKYPPCVHDYTPYCERQCGDKSNKQPHKHFGASAYAINASVTAIQAEILSNGPVEASFDVYEDFVPYKAGVYVHTVPGKRLGGHAIKIVGWGETNATATSPSVPYWTIANSWNKEWGEDGFFRIRRGTNECNIENKVVAGMPKL